MDEPVPVLEPVLPRRPRRTRMAVVVLVMTALAVVLLTAVFLVSRPASGIDEPLRLVVVKTDGSIATTDSLGEVLTERRRATSTSSRPGRRTGRALRRSAARATT